MLWGQVKELITPIVVVLVLVIYIDGVQDEAKESIRSEINSLGRALCEEGEETDAIGHYNRLVDTLVADYTDRKRENEQRKDFDKALINAGTIERLKLERIKQLPADCSVPLLPE